MLLNPNRASRLLTLKSRDVVTQPGLSYVLNEIINETILKDRTHKNNEGNLSNIEIEIGKMVNHSVLNHLFMLANSTQAHEEVNARTHLTLKQLKKELNKKDPKENHYQYLSDKINNF